MLIGRADFPSPFPLPARGSSQAQHAGKVPDDAWEYHIRKALNDAAYQALEYVPYCSTMPVPKSCEQPRYVWVSGSGRPGCLQGLLERTVMRMHAAAGIAPGECCAGRTHAHGLRQPGAHTRCATRWPPQKRKERH